MLKRYGRMLPLIGLLWCGLMAVANAQAVGDPLPDSSNPTSIVVSFPADLKQVDGTDVPDSGTVPAPSLHFKESSRRIYLTCDANVIASASGGSLPRQVALSNFRTPDGQSVHLVRGSADGGTAVSPVATGGRRIYLITWESVRLETQTRPAPVLVSIRVGAAADNPPSLAARFCFDGRQGCRKEREFVVTPTGISVRTLLDKFKSSPDKISVGYDFDQDDPVADFTARAVQLRAGPNETNPTFIYVDTGRGLPHRPEAYTVELAFPAADLRGAEEPGYFIPADSNTVSALADVDLAPVANERAKTEFFFEGTLTSVVNAKTRERANVGLFGLRFKPNIGLRYFNEDAPGKTVWWRAVRPVLEADVDTQPIADSDAPNRTVFGLDYELGRIAKNRSTFLQQLIWVNGIRYDSDRDFKLQTLYWQTEVSPRFLNFAQSRGYRLDQFRRQNFDPSIDRSSRFPFISSYLVRPSVGYQLGGTINRDNRITGFPTDNISRLFVNLTTAIEFRQLLQLSLDDTYYFLENAPRRQHRNYLTARLDFNTGALFNIDLGSLQSALTLKFQRGDLPPRFKPVNALSVGVRLYR